MTLRARLFAVLGTWPLVACVALLLLNDFWLKYAVPGLVTGKLSDFAGIGIVTLLLLAAFPRRRQRVFAAIAAGFAIWKSPFSQSLIDSLNLYLPFAIGRTVDYSDLLALAVMPVFAGIAKCPQRFSIPGRMCRRLLLPPVGLATVFALMATSVVATVQQYQVRQLDPAAELNHMVMATAVADVAKGFDLECRDCVNTHEQAKYAGDGLFLAYSFPDARTIQFDVEAFPNGIFFGESGDEKAEQLKTALRKRLARIYDHLEYVEPMRERRY